MQTCVLTYSTVCACVQLYVLTHMAHHTRKHAAIVSAKLNSAYSPMWISVERDCVTLVNVAHFVPMWFWFCVCVCGGCVREREREIDREREGGQWWDMLHKGEQWSVKENRWLPFLPSSFMCHLPHCVCVCVRARACVWVYVCVCVSMCAYIW